MKVYEMLKNYRIQKNLLQSDIAKATHTSITYVCKLETRAYLPSPKYLIAFCNKTGMDYRLIANSVIDERTDNLREILKQRYFNSGL